MKKTRRVIAKKMICFALAFSMVFANLMSTVVANASEAISMVDEEQTPTDAEEKNAELEPVSTEQISAEDEENASSQDDTTALGMEQTPTDAENIASGETDATDSEDAPAIDYNAVGINQAMAEVQGELNAVPQAQAKEGYSDYSPYMTKHILTVDGTTLKDGYTIDPSKSFALSLEFKMDMLDMAKDGLKYSYQLPKYITIGNQGSEDQPISLYNSMRVPIGTYYIEDDVMYVTFPGYYDSVVAFFNLEASWKGTDEKAQISVQWPKEEEKFNIDICDLSVAKKHSGYVTTDDGGLKVTFEVKVFPETEGATIDGITFSDAYSFKGLKLVENAYDGDTAICLTRYKADKSVLDTKYYKLSEVTTGTGKFEITPISIEAGGYFVVSYEAEMSFEDRMSIEAKGEKEEFDNKATVSYPYIDGDTGETHTLSSQAQVSGSYPTANKWIFKEKGDEESTRVMDNETKSIVPYVITINKYRNYSLGGSIVQDKITGVTGGKVVYDTNSYAATYVEIIVEDKVETKYQKWVVLDSDTYQKLQALAVSHDTTALGRLRDNDALEQAILGEIEETYREDYDEFTDEVALKYVFTDDASNNFVWIMPYDTTPTSYTIHYDTIADQAINSFTNSASLWYTEYQGVPSGPGVGWYKPVVKVMNATKSNDGVYVGKDGNYYVDYKITVGVGPNSAGFEDIAIKEMFPFHRLKINGETVPVIDWLAGIDADSVDITTLTSEQNRQLVDPLVKVSTKSDDQAVIAVVENSFSGFYYECSGDKVVEEFSSGNELEDAESIGFASSDANHPGNYAYPRTGGNYAETGDPVFMGYKGDSVTAGQFLVSQDLNRLNKGETFSFGGLMVWLGDLPGTEEGYTIDIEFTMQVNPLLVQQIPTILAESGEEYITNTNNAEVYTSFKKDYGDSSDILMNMRYGGELQNMSSPYWIGVNDIESGLEKNVVVDSSGVTHDDGKVTYQIDVNKSQTIVAQEEVYEVADILGLSGINYVKDSIVVKDKDGKVVYSESGNPAVDSSYEKHANLITVKTTDYDDKSNSFIMKIDNKDGDFTTQDSKLMQLTIQYDVDVSSIDTDVDIINDATLCTLEEGPNPDDTIRTQLGEAHVEYAIDKALDKVIDESPSKANDSTIGFYVDINPESSNAYELGDLKVNDTFTVEDEMGEELLLLIDTVKVCRYKGENYTSYEEITGDCNISYVDNIMDVTIPVKDEGYKYRIYYDAMVMAGAGEYTPYDNEVSILNTKVRNDKVSGKTWVYTYNEGSYATINEIDLHKYDRYDVSKGIKAKFLLYKKEDYKWTLITTEGSSHEYIETDTDGNVTIKNDMVSSDPVQLVKEDTWYKLVEIETEDDYVLDPTPIYYYVSSTGESLDADAVPSYIDEYQLVKLKSDVSLNKEDNPIIYVTNEHFGLDILKEDSENKTPLVGAEFELYSDSSCQNLIGTVVSGEDGIASYRNVELPDGTTALYLKETNAPDNYVLDDTVYKLTLEQGRVTKVTDVNDAEVELVSVSNDSHLSLIKFKNKYDSGRLLIKKTVKNGQEEEYAEAFTFSAHIYDKNGNLVDGKFPAVLTDSNGVETNQEITNGSVFYLKHQESLMITGLADGYTYKVVEVYNQNYYTSVSVADDENLADRVTNKQATQATGTLESGNMDTVTYTNQATDSLRVVKTAKYPNGSDMKLLDGLTITITNESLGKIAEVIWDAYQEKFILTYKANQRIALDNSISQGFELTGIKSSGINEEYIISESNCDIDGMGLFVKCREITPRSIATYKRDTTFEIGKHNNDYNNLSIELENNYTDDFVEVSLDATKKYDKAIKENIFSFGLYDKSTDSLLQEVYVDVNGNAQFEPIKISREGKYNYVIKEIIPDNAQYDSSKDAYVLNGVSYSEEKIPVEVKVVQDPDTQKLTLDYVYYNEAIDGDKEIKNTYEAEGSWTPKARKKINDLEFDEDDFSFTLTEYTDDTYTTVLKEIETVGNRDPHGVRTAYIKFSAVNYSYEDVGSHYYTIKEVIPSSAVNNQKNGVTYDDTEYKIQVDVTDNDNGRLNVKANYNNNDKEYIEIVNQYSASGTITFEGSKKLMLLGMEEDDFEFTLTEFYDYKRTKPVKDINGNPITLTFGHEAGSYDQVSKCSSGKINYPELSFDLDDVGEHYYILKEVVPQGAVDGVYDGIKYDTREREITVYVEDNGNGTLDVYEKVDNNLSFDFTNYADQTTQLKLSGTKELYGRSLREREFYFEAIEYYSEPGSTQMVQVRQGVVGYNKADGSIEFAPFIYDLEDVGRTYTYVIREYPAALDTGSYCPGVTYDPVVYVVNVTIILDANNKLVTTMNMYTQSGAVNSLDFSNTYDASGELTFTATKLLINKTIQADEFTFGIYEGKTLVSTGKNDAAGNVVFEPIKFYIDGELNGVESNIGEHTYIIKEIIPDQPKAGYVYDDAEYQVVVNATDNGLGGIAVEILEGATSDDNSAGIEYKVDIPEDKDANFENSYEAKGVLTITGAKEINDRSLADGEFTFTAVEYKLDGSEQVETGRTYKGTSDENGLITFDEITYEYSEKLDQTGAYIYYITEDPVKDDPSVICDTTEYTFGCVVGDDGAGELHIVELVTNEDIVFVNEYAPAGNLVINASKKAVTTSGNTYEDKTNTFKVNVYELDANNQEKLVTKISVKAGETAESATIVYGLDDVGTHRYKIVEDNTDKPGYVNDKTEYYINVEVSNVEDKYLQVSIKTDDGNEAATSKDGAVTYSVEYVNTYSAYGEVSFSGIKTIENADKMIKEYNPAEGDFTFTVYEIENVDGVETKTVVSTGKNTTDGTITFDKIIYSIDDVGTHNYLITEDKVNKTDNVLSMAEDVEVTVVVTDKCDGTLDIVTTYGDTSDKAEFVNMPTTIIIDKTTEGGKLLAGARLQIFDEEGNSVVEFTSTDKSKYLYGLKTNTVYTLVENAAPSGYMIAEDIKFTIDDEGNLYLIEGNNKTKVDRIIMKDYDVPNKTGDTTNVWVVMGIMLMALFGVICLGKLKSRLR